MLDKEYLLKAAATVRAGAPLIQKLAAENDELRRQNERLELEITARDLAKQAHEKNVMLDESMEDTVEHIKKIAEDPIELEAFRRSLSYAGNLPSQMRAKVAELDEDAERSRSGEGRMSPLMQFLVNGLLTGSVKNKDT